MEYDKTIRKEEVARKSNFFGTLIHTQRIAQGIKSQQLGEGIYSPSMIRRIERGERFPEKMMRDRLLSRLGIRHFNYEQYVFQTEYERWKFRTTLFQALRENALETAEQLLSQNKAAEAESKAEAQFFLVMQLWLMQKKQLPKQTWFPVLEQAIRLTVPQFQKKPLTELVLSTEERYLLSQYRYYEETGWNEEAGCCDVDYSCFYEESNVYCINFVIRARRSMFGLKRKNMESICSVRTVQRIEKGSERIHISIAEALLQKVGISMELQKNTLHNRQYIACEEARRLWETGKVPKAVYLKCLKEILEMTIPLEAALKPIQDVYLPNGRKLAGEKYLTTQEVVILELLAKETMETELKSRYQNALEEYAAWKKGDMVWLRISTEQEEISKQEEMAKPTS